ncbi:MAG: hypothetical protein HC907_36100 [Richelia sp. SM1_7_0]|nr:hypothetical protein [Richelia sp. SM1_7_0]
MYNLIYFSRHLNGDMAGIPPQLLNQLRQTLLQCEQFESDRKLRTIFTYEPLRPWRSSLPQADSLTSRVDNLIRFLVEKHRSDTKENALVLFLHLLSEQIDEADERHQQLADLALEVERVISSSDKTNISKANINSDKLSKYLENIRQKLIKEGCISPQNAVSHEDKNFNLVGKITNFELSFGFFNMRGDAFFIFPTLTIVISKLSEGILICVYNMQQKNLHHLLLDNL